MKKIVFTLLVLSSFFVCDNVFAYDFEINDDNSGVVEYRYASNHVFTSNSTLNTINNFNGLSGKFIKFDNLTSWQYAFAYGFSIPMNKFELSDYEKQDFIFTFYLKNSVDLSSIKLRTIFTTNYDKFGTNYDFNKDLGLADNQLLYYEDYAFITSFPRCDSESDPRVHKCTVKVSANLNLINKKFNNNNMYFIVLFGRDYESIYYENITIPTNFSYDVSYDSSTELNPNNDIDWTNEEIVKKSFWDRLGEAILSIIKLPMRLVELLLDLLKSLFIPGDEYLNNWFTSLRDSVESQLGFLNYPIVWILDILNKFLTLEDTGSYLISWPDISVPNFEDYVIIKSGSFDLATLLANPTIKSFHDMYLIIINALILLSFFNLCLNVSSRIFGGDVDNYEYLTVDEGYNIDGQTGEVNSLWFRKRTSTRKKVS